jgi:multidrug efflux pump
MIISNTALKNRTSVFFLTLLIVIVGLSAYLALPRESFPQIKIPTILVMTPYPGVSPEDVESLVTTPIEKKLKELSDVKVIKSSSSEGFSSISVEFNPEVDMDVALQRTRDKVDLAKPDLPNDVEESQIDEINLDNVPVLIINLYASYDLVKLKDVAEDLQDKLETISGVLEVRLVGGYEQEVKIEVDPQKLRYYNIALEDVITAIQTENRTIPGGTMEIGRLKYLVRIPGEYDEPVNMRDIMLKDTGSKIYLRDVASVSFGIKEVETISRVNGRPSISLSVVKRAGENIVQLADAAKEILAQEKLKFPRGTEVLLINDQSKDIKQMVNELENNIISGLILVVLVLYFFLGTRNGLLVGIAIPLSMFLSFIILSLMGYTLNMMVLFSLILALGMLVDNAIVVIENIYRHREEGYSLSEAARIGTSEVAVPIITSTLTTLTAFSPLIFWEGIIGQFMSLLPITLIITLASSLFVGLIINPVTGARFIRINKRELIGTPLLTWLIDRYDTTIRLALKNRGLVILAAFSSWIGTLLIFATIGFTGVEFFPNLEPNLIWVDVDAKLGTRLEETDRIVREIEAKIPDYPDIKAYVADVGTSHEGMNMGAASGSPAHLGRITLEVIDRKDRTQNSFTTMKQVRASVRDIVGARIEVDKPDDGPPTGAPVQIEVSGDDFQLLGKISRNIRDQIGGTQGLVDLKDDFSQGSPEIRVTIDREKARLFGVSTSAIAQTIRTAINGTEASKYRVGEDEYDIVVRFARDQRAYVEQMRDIPLFHKDKQIPLSNLASILFTGGLGTVKHVDLDKVVTITGNAAEGYNANAILNDVKDQLSDYPLPSGYKLSYTGQDEEQAKSFAFLMQAFMIAFLLIFFILVAQFDSMTLPLVIMVSIILSLIGVFTGLMVTQLPFGIIMTFIGIISLAGIVVNNAIVLIDYINKLRERGLALDEAIIRGGKTRLRPVLLTAITTVLGLVPLTLGINIDFIGAISGDFSNLFEFGAESSQFWRNMGWAVIFGLSFSTGLTLVVVPVLYSVVANLSETFAQMFKLGKYADSASQNEKVTKA